MQPQCIGLSGLRHFVIFAAFTIAASAEVYAQEGEPTPEHSPSPLTVRLDSTVGQKPVFYQEDGRYLELTLRLNYKVNPSATLGLVQGAKVSKKVEEPAKSNFNAEDTLLRLTFPDFYQMADSKLKFSARLQDMILANTPTSRRNGLKNTIAGRFAAAHTLGDLSTVALVDLNHSFYEYTKNPDGKANPQNTLVLTAGSSYALNDSWNLGFTYSYLDRVLHGGKHAYLFSFNPELGYKISNKLALFAGLETTDAYLKEFEGVKGYQKFHEYLYTEDLSQFYLRLESTL